MYRFEEVVFALNRTLDFVPSLNRWAARWLAIRHVKYTPCSPVLPNWTGQPRMRDTGRAS